jgi:hypothetical protein
MFVVKIVLHCYSGFAFGQPNDALCFLLHACHCTNCGSSSAYSIWKHLCMRMEYAQENVCVCARARACLRKLFELMNMIQQIPSIFLFSKVIGNQNCIHNFL